MKKSFTIIDLTMVYIDICYIKWYNEVIKRKVDFYMKIVVYDTENGFTEVTTKELNSYEDFKEILGELVLGRYKSSFYQAFVVDENKKIDYRINATTLSRIMDNEDEHKAYLRLKKIGTNAGVMRLNEYYKK